MIISEQAKGYSVSYFEILQIYYYLQTGATKLYVDKFATTNVFNLMNSQNISNKITKTILICFSKALCLWLIEFKGCNSKKS